jgi:hypothetical protein
MAQRIVHPVTPARTHQGSGETSITAGREVSRALLALAAALAWGALAILVGT